MNFPHFLVPELMLIFITLTVSLLPHEPIPHFIYIQVCLSKRIGKKEENKKKKIGGKIPMAESR